MADKTAPRQIEMELGHDGINWILSNDELRISARELDDLDRKLEDSLSEEWQNNPIQVHMHTDNDIIPEWMRPYMDHYFNRILELPLKY
ncbi:MAG: hypothetical protein CSB24_04765 [Deltaproteobacteria bacterium]|nr:MAG: hypothetical protein CSB24_04765 [Deltaproteobacteria bacterium]